MQQSTPFIRNLLWFLASLALAFFVWLIATTQADPIQERLFSNVPVQGFAPDSGILLTNSTAVRRPVRVYVRARQSVLDLLTSDDITVTADLSDLPPGTHQVEFGVNVVGGSAITRTQPRQVTIVLEQEFSQQKPVRAEIVEAPPAGYVVENITLAENQILVSGVQSRVQEVVAVEAQLDLSEERNALDREFPLVAVNAEGNPVSDVTVAQLVVRVTVDIQQSENLRLVSVQPNIAIDTVPAGYIPRLESYSPTAVSIRGSEESLNQLPDTIQTASIDLTNRTESFDISVPVNLTDLPDDVIIEGDSLINVSIEIVPRETTRSFDNVAVSFAGLSPATVARAIPSQVNVLVTGPQPVLDALTPEDIRVIVDLESRAPGTYDLNPTVNISRGELPADGISVLPSTIGVIISAIPTPTPAETEEASAALTPTP